MYNDVDIEMVELAETANAAAATRKNTGELTPHLRELLISEVSAAFWYGNSTTNTAILFCQDYHLNFDDPEVYAAFTEGVEHGRRRHEADERERKAQLRR